MTEPKSAFPWCEEGLKLLNAINKEIKNAGGRVALAKILIDEAPGFYTSETKSTIAMKYRNHQSSTRIRAKIEKRDDYYWTEEDKQFLLANYGKMKTYRIANLLKRTSATCKKMFQLLASREQKNAIPQKYKAKLRNFRSV